MANETNEIRTFETESQFFGFSPITIVDLVINAVNDYVFDGADGVFECLTKSDSGLNFDREQTQKAVDAVLGVIQDAVGKYFDKFELYCLNELFDLTKSNTHIPVPGDLRASAGRYANEDDDALLKEIQSLRKRLFIETYMQQQLKAQLEGIKSKAKPDSDKKPLDAKAVEAICRKAGAPLVTETVNFVCDQVIRLSQLGKKMSSRYHELHPENNDDASASKRARVSDPQALADNL